MYRGSLSAILLVRRVPWEWQKKAEKKKTKDAETAEFHRGQPDAPGGFLEILEAPKISALSYVSWGMEGGVFPNPSWAISSRHFGICKVGNIAEQNQQSQRGIKTDGVRNGKFFGFLKPGILVPVYSVTRLGVSFATPKGVPKRMVFIRPEFCSEICLEFRTFRALFPGKLTLLQKESGKRSLARSDRSDTKSDRK